MNQELNFDVGLHQEKIIVFCDSQGATYLTKDQVFHDKTKHINVRYHFICAKKRIEVKKIGTVSNPADM